MRDLVGHDRRPSAFLVYLLTQSSIEARIADLVAEKKAFFSGLFHGDTNEVRFERCSSSSLASRESSNPPGPRSRSWTRPHPKSKASAEREADALVAAAEEGGGAPAADLGPAAAPPAGRRGVGSRGRTRAAPSR